MRLKTLVSYSLRVCTLAQAIQILDNASEAGEITHVKLILSQKTEPAKKQRAPRANPKVSSQPAQPGRIHLHGTEGTVREFRP